jgi:hypothetical protein
MIPLMIRASPALQQKVRRFDSPKTSSAALFQALIQGLPGDPEPLGNEGGQAEKKSGMFFPGGKGELPP